MENSGSRRRIIVRRKKKIQVETREEKNKLEEEY